MEGRHREGRELSMWEVRRGADGRSAGGRRAGAHQDRPSGHGWQVLARANPEHGAGAVADSGPSVSTRWEGTLGWPLRRPCALPADRRLLRSQMFTPFLIGSSLGLENRVAYLRKLRTRGSSYETCVRGLLVLRAANASAHSHGRCSALAVLRGGKRGMARTGNQEEETWDQRSSNT